jgi:hypothetical protein
MISKYNFLAAAKTGQGATLLVLATNKQLNVSRTHASAVERHSALSILGRRKPNVGFSCRPPVIAVSQDNGLQDWIIPDEELENIFFCCTKWKTAHAQKASMLTNLDSATGALCRGSVKSTTASTTVTSSKSTMQAHAVVDTKAGMALK